MIMKLELKHLSAYLPYGLRMIRNNFIGNLICIKLPTENSIVDYFEFRVSCSNWWENTIDDTNPYKPILRPLSDLDEDGEINTPEYLQGCCYSYVQNLISQHYDVFGLIEKGLAIDINTL